MRPVASGSTLLGLSEQGGTHLPATWQLWVLFKLQGLLFLLSFPLCPMSQPRTLETTYEVYLSQPESLVFPLWPGSVQRPWPHSPHPCEVCMRVSVSCTCELPEGKISCLGEPGFKPFFLPCHHGECLAV